MTTKPSSNQQPVRELTAAERQRVEELRRVERVIRDARRIRFPKRKAASAANPAPSLRRPQPAEGPARPLTAAEQQRIAERRHVEAVMKNARRAKLPFQRKARPAVAGGAAATVSAPPSGRHASAWTRAFAISIVALACAILALAIATTVQNSRLASDLAAVKQETSNQGERQQASLDRMEDALAEVAAAETRVDAGLQVVRSSQQALETAVEALEAARTSDASQWQERLSGVETATRDGLAGLASRMDREEGLAAAVERLLPLLPKPEAAPSEPQETTPQASP